MRKRKLMTRDTVQGVSMQIWTKRSLSPNLNGRVRLTLAARWCGARYYGVGRRKPPSLHPTTPPPTFMLLVVGLFWTCCLKRKGYSLETIFEFRPCNKCPRTMWAESSQAIGLVNFGCPSLLLVLASNCVAGLDGVSLTSSSISSFFKRFSSRASASDLLCD